MGKVKTRLAHAIGDEAALKLYKCFVKDTVEKLKKLDCDIHLFLTREATKGDMRAWLGSNLPRHVQEGNDLGERMKNAFYDMFGLGYGSCLVMGTDLPDVPLTVPVEAFHKLEKSGAVIAPSEDGGYYLLGFQRAGFLPAVFHRVEWGTDKVFSQTLDIFQRHQRSPLILPVWWDVDDIGDLEDLFRRNQNNQAFQSSHTMKVLRTIF